MSEKPKPSQLQTYSHTSEAQKAGAALAAQRGNTPSMPLTPDQKSQLASARYIEQKKKKAAAAVQAARDVAAQQVRQLEIVTAINGETWYIVETDKYGTLYSLFPDGHDPFRSTDW